MFDLSISERISNLITSINRQFNNRAVIENTKKGKIPSITLKTEVKDNILWLQFIGTRTFSITIPLPFVENGVTLIKENGVVRAICSYWLEKEQELFDYTSVMYNIICADGSEFVSNNLTKGYPFLQQIIFAFENNNQSIIIYRLQKVINEIVNRMPLHKTNLNSWVMNNRLIIIDDVFENLRSPTERLSYQVDKARKYFSKGWTSIGLSDGVLADKNYTLTNYGLRKLSPFGIKYHNPQRNLYTTLEMQGDELPIVRSQSMQKLMDQGITRTGWNFFTLFADVPDVFEDQIIVDNIHRDKFVTYTKKFQVFGKIFVKVNENVKPGHVLGNSPDGVDKLFITKCNAAKVKEIFDTTTNVGSVEIPVHNIIVEYQRKFIDGLKLTNVHGNKGVIRLMDLGYAIDPRTGQKQKIDVITSAKAIGKRKNYGQIIEALINCLNDKESIILPDEWYMPIEEIKTNLRNHGFNENGTWNCETPYGKLYGICGRVFWGCIKTPEDQLWHKNATTTHNSSGIRKAGLKFSHVEIRALKTRFGDKNPVIDEIMSYAQGAENLQELLNMASSKIGILPKDKIVKDVTNTKPLDQFGGTIVAGQYINGTVVDEFFAPDGFIFKLPLPYQTLTDNKDETFYEGFPQEERSQLLEKAANVYLTDKIYIPEGILRKCWQHESSKYGLNDIGTIVNNVILMSHRLTQNDSFRGLYYKHLQEFFRRISAIVGTKRGQIANYGMSVRYPFSVKGVATLSTTLPKNTIEIHRSLAKTLNVRNDDVVIVERFPCLGFMSVRLQKVRITDDVMCKYTIRASGNSLVSQNLDFDGDTLFVASFHTFKARSALNKEWTNPNSTCYAEIKRLNERKGAPHIKCYNLDDYKIIPFSRLTNEEHAFIIEKNTGVKAQTGPIIALTYNIMRIVENSTLERSQKLRVGVEMFLEKAAQSVFEQKHGGQSLHEIVIKSICTGNIESLVEEGFKRSTTTMIVDLVKQKAVSLGIMDLIKYYEFAEENNISNIISLIVRKQNRIYFASRSELASMPLLKALDKEAVDVPSKMFKWVMENKTKIINTKADMFELEDKLKNFNDDRYKYACSSLCSLTQNIFNQEVSTMSKLLHDIRNGFRNRTIGEHRYANTVGYRA